VIADIDLNVVAKQNWVADRGLLDMARARMDEVVVAMHTKNGLLAEIEKIEPRGNVRPEIEEFLQDYTFGPEHTYLAGSSIHFDRDFLIEQTDLDLRKFFSRRLFDISTIKTGTRLWCEPAALDPLDDDAKPHRAIPDCLMSLEELRHYRDRLFARARVVGEAGKGLAAFIENALAGEKNYNATMAGEVRRHAHPVNPAERLGFYDGRTETKKAPVCWNCHKAREENKDPCPHCAYVPGSVAEDK
jgi:oligoribonuclease